MHKFSGGYLAKANDVLLLCRAVLFTPPEAFNRDGINSVATLIPCAVMMGVITDTVYYREIFVLYLLKAL